MQPVQDVDDKNNLLKLLSGLSKTRTLAPNDVRRLRQALYDLGALDRSHAAMIMHVNRVIAGRDDHWAEFYLEALAGFFLEHAGDHISLPPERKELLLRWLGDAVSVDDTCEQRLVLRLFLRVREASERLETWIFAAIENNLLNQDRRWCSDELRIPGLIDAIDGQTIARLIKGDRSDALPTISRAGMEFLIRLDAKATDFIDPTAWRRLLVESLARHVFADEEFVADFSSVRKSDVLDGFMNRLGSRYSVDEINKLREDVLLARGWMMTIGSGVEPTSELRPAN